MAKTNAKKYLSDERFARLEESLQQALEHVSGERNDLRTTVLPVPPMKKRKKNYVSDEEFAEITSALERTIEHARGERKDFRTTIWLKPTIDKQGNLQPRRAVMLNPQTPKSSEENTNE